MRKTSADGKTTINPSLEESYCGSVLGANTEKISNPARKSAGTKYRYLTTSSHLAISINGNVKEIIKNNASVNLTNNPTLTFQYAA